MKLTFLIFFGYKSVCVQFFIETGKANIFYIKDELKIFLYFKGVIPIFSLKQRIK